MDLYVTKVQVSSNVESKTMCNLLKGDSKVSKIIIESSSIKQNIFVWTKECMLTEFELN